MKIALPRVSCDHVNGADYPDNPRQGEIKGYFLSVEQAENILEALKIGKEGATWGRNEGQMHDGDLQCVEKAIVIMTGGLDNDRR